MRPTDRSDDVSSGAAPIALHHAAGACATPGCLAAAGFIRPDAEHPVLACGAHAAALGPGGVPLELAETCDHPGCWRTPALGRDPGGGGGYAWETCALHQRPEHRLIRRFGPLAGGAADGRAAGGGGMAAPGLADRVA